MSDEGMNLKVDALRSEKRHKEQEVGMLEDDLVDERSVHECIFGFGKGKKGSKDMSAANAGKS